MAPKCLIRLDSNVIHSLWITLWETLGLFMQLVTNWGFPRNTN